MRKLLSIAVLGLSLGALAGCGEEPIPDFPTFTRDVGPLMHARCLRCHGAGGTLNNDPDIGLDAQGNPRKPVAFQATTYEAVSGTVALVNLYFDDDPMHAIYKTDEHRMPPRPAPKLTDREREIVSRWLASPLP